MRSAVGLLLLLLLSGLPACEEAGDDKPYVEFAGGGFIFNYNLAQAYYGFIIRATRSIPPGTIIEAQFEDPAGGPPLPVQQVARVGGIEYSFRTPPVQGVKAERDYQVILRLIEPESRTVIASYSKSFRSSADQDILPKKPLTVGPGYQANPESEIVNPPAEGSGG
ncbi:MAG: hypothetical protein ACFCUQ_13625 [Kiloniellales bacterium]